MFKARPLGESNEWQTTGQIVAGKIRAIITFCAKGLVISLAEHLQCPGLNLYEVRPH